VHFVAYKFPDSIRIIRFCLDIKPSVNWNFSRTDAQLKCSFISKDSLVIHTVHANSSSP